MKIFLRYLIHQLIIVFFIGINDVTEIENRVKLFYKAYRNSNQTTDILLILIKGIRNPDVKGNQIQIDPNIKINGFILTPNNEEIREII